MTVGTRGSPLRKAARKKMRVAKRREKVAKLYVGALEKGADVGKAQLEIAAELGIAQSTGSKDLNAALALSHEHTLSFALEIRARAQEGIEKGIAFLFEQRALLQEQYAETRTAWDRSKAPRAIRGRESNIQTDDQGKISPRGPGRTWAEERDQYGDPRIMSNLTSIQSELRQNEAEIREHWTELAKLHGAHAPTKQAWTTPDGQRPAPPNVLVIRVGPDDLADLQGP